ncbi:MAG: cell surface protein SprA [Ignavibacteriaceae bacterium]
MSHYPLRVHIRNRKIKLFQEIIRVILGGSLLFYAGINLGFKSPYSSPINKAIWINVFFQLISAQNSPIKEVKIPISPGKELVSRPEEKIITENQNHPELKYRGEFRSPLDSNEVMQRPGINNDSSFSAKNDSLNLKADSLAARKDTLDQMSIDSTARLKYFHPERKDLPYVTLKQKRPSPFLAQPSLGLRTRTVEIDSTGKNVNIVEKVAGQKTKIILTMPLDEYINMKLATRERTMWEDLGHQYELQNSEKGLQDVIKNITDFEIPLPSVGVLSIFGEPKISLRIGGAVDIHGAWRNETTQGVTASRLGNTRNEPDFKQQVQINVNGTIGDKLNISADWNTERTFQYENQLKIKYTGYEDEIIQSIEAGNVSLQTSPLVGGSEALFGLKANFQMGPFSLTTIASQKKGETKEVSVNSGSTSQEFNLRAYDYSTNHYFVDTTYASQNPTLNIFENYYNNSTPQIIANGFYTIKDIEVWKSINTIGRDPSKERQANAYINLPALNAGGTYDTTWRNLNNPQPGISETGRFLQLTQDVDYTLQPETGYITFKTQINDDDIIAVAYRMENGPGPNDDLYFGEFLSTANAANDSILVLKLVKPKNLQPQFTEAWKLLMKNFYPLGGRNIKQDNFIFNLAYEVPGQDPITEDKGIKFLQAFGLDKVNAAGGNTPDDIFDWVPGVTILPETGEILFPVLEPFGKGFPSDLPDSLKFQDIYDTTKTFAQNVKTKDKWELTGKYSGEATSVYPLGFNVVENSVKVLLNGRELTPGVDYVVDYNSGQLTIRNDAALVPGADLKITYEQNDLFSLASKTLLGARGLLNISDKTKLGFSILNLNQQTLSDKVRIGEEPLSNTIYGVDFNTAGDLPFLTKAISKIIPTKQMSSFTLAGEYAYMNPDPNTKKSTIASDNGASIAYIDDFEGSKRTIPLGVSYTGWHDLSPPEKLPLLMDTSAAAMMKYKSESFWYTETSTVNVNDVWPLKKVAKSDQLISVLDYVYRPGIPGTYSGYHGKDSKGNDTWGEIPDYAKTNKKMNWGGMMKLLSSTANNLTEENIEYIDIWMQPEEVPKDAKMIIDLGRISEDVIPNRKLDTEDKPPYNEVINEGEDTGIDGMNDDQERAAYHEPGVQDPAHDNFSFTGQSPNYMDYEHINGTEKNAQLTDIGRVPDTEDLNRNGSTDLVNSYFRYEVPLDTTKNKFIAGGGNVFYINNVPQTPYYLFRIPLKDFDRTIGSPSLSDVEYIRLVFTGVDTVVRVRIAEFDLVGNQWQKLDQTDSVMSISVKSIEDNPDYTSPPGVQRERDNTQTTETVLQNEQSMNLIFKDLPEGESREAVKYLYRPLDVFNYSEMKLFIHGDLKQAPGSISYSDVSKGLYTSEVYFRFGTDSNNYYEYRQPVVAGWNEISIPFKELTAIKGTRSEDSINAVVERSVDGKPGHFYKVKGQPSLTSVRFLDVGVLNLDNNFNQGPVSGEVWVNELRVIGADDHPGWAYNASTSLKLADLLTVNFNLSQTDPNFHRLSDRFGSRIASKNWNTSLQMDVLKLLPFDMPGSNLNINYSHTESIANPKYYPGTDVSVDAAAALADQAYGNPNSNITKTSNQIRSETQSLNVSDSYSASNVKIKIPTSFWLIRDTWNALTFGFNYNRTFSRNPTTLSNKYWIWNASLNYGLNLGNDYFFYPKDIPVLGVIFSLLPDYTNTKIYYTPQNFSFNFQTRRNRTVNVTRARLNSPSQSLTSRDFSAQRGFNFAWKMSEGGLLNLSMNYNVNINSSLLYLETDNAGNQRTSSAIFWDILTKDHFGRDNRYSQSFDLKSAPALPSFWDINKYFSLNAGYSVTYQWNYDFRQPDLGRSAGFSNRSTVGLVLKLNALTEPLFAHKEEENPEQSQQNTNSRGRGRNFGENQNNERSPVERNVIQRGNNNPQNSERVNSPNDSSSVADTTGIAKPKKHALKNALLFLESLVQFIFFKYETITINFSNSNSLSKSGILGDGTGFGNFWGFKTNYNNGPSRGFMLGLSGDVGPRAPNGNLSDVFSQKNNLDFSTSRPLWEGASIDLNWNVGWSINKNSTISNNNGVSTVTNLSSTGTIERSFLTFPPFLFFSSLNNGINQVHKLDPEGKDLPDAFIKGFESLPLLSKLGPFQDIAKYIPRPNWNINWSGLESFSLFKSFAKRVSLSHAYKSTYSEGWKITPDGLKQIQTQRIQYGFTPLVGLNFTFNELWGGNINANIKYSTNTSYDLGTSTKNISETSSKDIGITAGYSKSGFEIPLFGISLKNDIEFSFSYTSSQNSTVIYDMTNFKDGGLPQDGTTRTTIEPRVKYTISSKVTLSIFYTRTSVTPEGAARIPPTTTNEAGLDVHISIQ